MKYPSLRLVAEAELAAREAMALWPLHEATLARRLTYAPMPAASSLIAVDAYRQERCWSGFIELSEWFAHTSPALASLARASNGDGSGHAEQVQELFEASPRPLDMGFPELAYEVLRLQRDQPRPPSDQCLLSIATPQGRVWLSDYPSVAAPAAPAISAALRTLLPLALTWRLGSSNVSRRLIAALQSGDVLLINREAFDVISVDKVIGRFSINENGELSVQAASQNGTLENAEALPGISRGKTLSDIPIQLDFILQRRTMTVSELDALYRGQVLQLDPQAEQQVEIMVNGVRIAKGELVELNGRLGVELHDITSAQHRDGKQRV